MTRRTDGATRSVRKSVVTRSEGSLCLHTSQKCAQEDDIKHKGHLNLEFVDAKKAHVNAKIDEEEWAALPNEFEQIGRKVRQVEEMVV